MTDSLRRYPSLRARWTRCARHAWRLWAVGAITLTCCGPASSQMASRDLFERQTVTTGAGPQTVLSGFFRRGQVADLVILRGGSSQPEVEVFGYEDGAWDSVFRADLPPEVLFVDVARVGDQDQLILYEPGEVHIFDLDTLKVSPLASITSSTSTNL